MAIAAKGAKCEKCGYDKCMEALEFHHLNESDKNFGLSEKGYARSWKRIEKELKKCVLLCANCHREVHADVAAPGGNIRMKNWVNSGKPDSASSGYGNPEPSPFTQGRFVSEREGAETKG